MLFACTSVALAVITLCPAPQESPLLGHRIEGTVYDHDGQVVSGASLWVSSQAAQPVGPIWELVASATSSDAGRFELTIPPDWIEARGVLRALSVLVWKEGHGVFQASWAPDEVPAGVAFEPWLSRPASAEFMVVDELGEPYPGARVFPAALSYPDTGGGLRIAPDAWDGAASFVTDSEGRVSLPFAREAVVELSIQPVEFERGELVAAKRDQMHLPSTVVLHRSYRRPIRSAPVSDGEESPPEVWIRGMVVGEDEAPVEGAWVTAALLGEERRFRVFTAVADADGSFRLGPVAPESSYVVAAHAGQRFGSVLASAPTEAGSAEPIRLTLAPALQARVDVEWTGEGPPPRVRMTLVGPDAQKFSNVEGSLIAGGRLYQPIEAGATARPDRALERGTQYAIRYEGWGDEDQRRIEPGATAFMPAETLAAGITIAPSARWVTPRLTAFGVDAAAGGELRVRLRTSEYWSPVGADLSYSAIGGEFSDDIALFERDGVIETVSVVHGLREQLTVVQDSSPPDAEPRDEKADAAMVKRLAWREVESALDAGADDMVPRWLEPLMHVDADGVLEFLDSGVWEDPMNASHALAMLTERLAASSPDDALSLAARPSQVHRRPYIVHLAAPFMEESAALEELARAAAEAPTGSGGADHLQTASLIARSLFELGQDAAARAVLEPAREVARTLPRNGDTTFYLGEFGAAISLVDREEGLEWIQSPESHSDRFRSMARAVGWLARVDLDASEAVLAAMRGDNSQFYIDLALNALVYHAALVDEQRAFQLADEHATSAIPYGLIALALAEQDAKDEAMEALSLAFDRVDGDAAGSNAQRRHPVMVAAFLLGIADVVDPEGFDGWQRRALDVPRASRGAATTHVSALARAEACLSIALSERSPQLAAAILEPWVDALLANGPRSKGARGELRAIASALALVQGEHLEAKLEELPVDLRERALELGMGALARTGDPIGKLFASRDLLFGSWWPGESVY